MALYSDQHSIFFVTKKALTIEEQLVAQSQPTQFGRLVSELGIQLIRARSPQAKGRVERLWGTFQDRLVSELRLAGAISREQANVVLQRHLLRHNQRFSVPAADPVPAWSPWPKGRQFSEVFCFKFRRVVANDNTVRLGKLVIDLPPNRQRISYARCRVEVQQRFDGTIHVFHEGSRLTSLVQAPTDPDNLRLPALSQSKAAELPPLLPERVRPRPPSPLAWKQPHPWRLYPAVARKESLNR
jgi:hypothetical protein